MKTTLLLSLLLVGCGVPESQLPVDPGQPATTQPEQTGLDPHQQQQQQQELTGFPCDVREVLQAACAGCHAQAVYFGSFTTRAEVATLAPRAHERVSSFMQPMPPYGAQRQLSAQEKDVLLTWLAAGAPAGTCGPLTGS
jgi:uncharacterized membrane protein